MLLDEPSSALDKDTSTNIAKWFFDQSDLAVIAVSQNHIWQNTFPSTWLFQNKTVINSKGR